MLYTDLFKLCKKLVLEYLTRCGVHRVIYCENCAEYATYVLEYLLQCVVYSERMLNEELVLEYLTHCRLYRETEMRG